MPPLEENLELGFGLDDEAASRMKTPLSEQIIAFDEFGKATQALETAVILPGGQQFARGFISGLFQTSIAALFHSAAHRSRRGCL
jgi:hypothetical protein